MGSLTIAPLGCGQEASAATPAEGAHGRRLLDFFASTPRVFRTAPCVDPDRDQGPTRRPMLACKAAGAAVRLTG